MPARWPAFANSTRWFPIDGAIALLRSVAQCLLRLLAPARAAAALAAGRLRCGAGAGRTLLHAGLAGACFLCHFNLLVAQRRNGFPLPTAVAILPQRAGGGGPPKAGGGAVTRMN